MDSSQGNLGSKELGSIIPVLGGTPPNMTTVLDAELSIIALSTRWSSRGSRYHLKF